MRARARDGGLRAWQSRGNWPRHSRFFRQRRNGFRAGAAQVPIQLGARTSQGVRVRNRLGPLVQFVGITSRGKVPTAGQWCSHCKSRMSASDSKRTYGPPGIPAGRPIHLNGRTRYRPVRAKHAGVPRFGKQHLTATFAWVETSASSGWHCLGC